MPAKFNGTSPNPNTPKLFSYDDRGLSVPKAIPIGNITYSFVKTKSQVRPDFYSKHEAVKQNNF